MTCATNSASASGRISCSPAPLIPLSTTSFMDNVRAEAEDNVRRLRHHPSIALWCGNNEMEQGWVGDEWNDRQMSWADYGKIFDKLLPEITGETRPGPRLLAVQPPFPPRRPERFQQPAVGRRPSLGCLARQETV